jgi:hypothetical protein
MAYTPVHTGFFMLQNGCVCDIHIINTDTHYHFDLVTTNALLNNNLATRIRTVEGSLIRLATHLLGLERDELCNHLQKVIVAFLKNSDVFGDALNASIAQCFWLIFGEVVILEREPLGYAPRTLRQAMHYFNGEFIQFRLNLMQAIPDNIQQIILNPPLVDVAANEARGDMELIEVAANEAQGEVEWIENHPIVDVAANEAQGDMELIEVAANEAQGDVEETETVSQDVLLEPVNGALSHIDQGIRDYLLDPRRSERIKAREISANTEELTGKRQRT